jgi:hypothetical protein
LATHEIGGEKHHEIAGIVMVRHRHVHQRAIATIGDGTTKEYGAVAAYVADTQRGELDAGKAYLGVHSLIAAAAAVGLVLMDNTVIACRGAQRAIGLDVLGADHITDYIGIKIRLTRTERGAVQMDVVGHPVRRDDDRRNGTGIADDALDVRKPVEHVGAVINRVTDVNIQITGVEIDPQTASVAVRRRFIGEQRTCGQEQANESRQPNRQAVRPGRRVQPGRLGLFSERIRGCCSASLWLRRLGVVYHTFGSVRSGIRGRAVRAVVPCLSFHFEKGFQCSTGHPT